MRKSYVIDSGKFAAEFARCCKEYNDLKIAVAWCGNPNQILPYKLLDNFGGNVKAIVGIAFNHTHPDAIEWFLDIGADLRVFKDDAELFHPKIYLFRDKKRYALFVGSSNLTYGGFYANYETNCLIEGESSKTPTDISLLEKSIAKWHSQEFSFKLKTLAQWLSGTLQSLCSQAAKTGATDTAQIRGRVFYCKLAPACGLGYLLQKSA
jgi:hypothetical protein